MPFDHAQIKPLLAARNLTIREAAKLMEIREQELSAIASGRRENPTLATLEKLASVLKIKPAKLIRE